MGRNDSVKFSEHQAILSKFANPRTGIGNRILFAGLSLTVNMA
jgi:hypothetical protein